MAVQQQGTTMSKSKRPPKSIPIMASPHPAPSSIMLPSPTPTRYWFSLSHSVVIAVPKSFHGHYYFENSREFNLHLELLSYVVKWFHEIFSNARKILQLFIVIRFHEKNLFFAGKEFIGPNLTLAEVRSKDTGDIYCIASNGYQPSVSQKFELTINCKSDFNSVKI